MSSYYLIKLFGLDFCGNAFVILLAFIFGDDLSHVESIFQLVIFRNPRPFPRSFPKKKHRLRKDGTLQWLHPDAELQVTVHYEAWSIGSCSGVPGVFFAYSFESRCRFQGIPWKKWCKGWRWIGWVFFFLRWCFQIRILIFVFTPIWEKWSILIHVAICRF